LTRREQNEEKNKSLRVVIDTNVIISSLLSEGPPRDVLRLAYKKRIHLVMSPFILGEVEYVLKEKFKWEDKKVWEFLKELRSLSHLVETSVKLSIQNVPQEDCEIVECGLEGKAQVIVSGDKKHLLPLKEYQDIKIVSPTEFLREWYKH